MSALLTLAELCLHSSPFTRSKMLLSMTKVDETDGSLHTTEYKTSKFDKTLDNIRIEKIILAPIWACQALIWATKFYFEISAVIWNLILGAPKLFL